MRRFSLAICRAACLFLGSWLLLGGTFAATTEMVSHNAPNYFTRVWQVENGLPQNTVTALAQTHDGYLWVGTYGGLARFDGVQFTIFDEKNTPALRDSRVTSLFVADDGTLWIGHENASLTTFKDGSFQTVQIRNESKITDIASDETGDVWVLNEEGLLTRVRDGRALASPTGSAEKIVYLTRTTNGTIWLTHDGRLSRLAHGSSFQLQSGETNTYAQGVCPSHDGGLWVGSNGRLHKLRDGHWTPNLAAPWGNAVPLARMLETSDGRLLAATPTDGFYLVFPGTEQPPVHFDLTNGFASDGITSAMEDREGNLWLGTADSGLIELHRNNIQRLAPPDNWRGLRILSVCAGQAANELWVGTEGAGLYHYLNGDWQNFGFTNGLGNPYVWAIAEDAAKNLFAGTWGAGLFVREGDRFKAAPGMENLGLAVPALLPARGGGLWVGTGAGLLRYQASQTNWYTETGGKSLRDVRAIAEATNGTVWFGLADNGLACLESNRVHMYGRADGLPSDRIECLRLDAEGALWIGTFGGGLCRFQAGKFSVIEREQGLPSSVISDIEEDGRGFFWMSSRGGIIRASKSELNRCADGAIKEIHCLTFGIDDGMPTIECSSGLQPAGCRTPDGRLWFPTTKGLVMVNPNEISINHLPPPMALEELLVDGRPVARLTSPLKIPPGQNRLEIHFTGLSFVAPEKVHFKYRIEGLEQDWVDAGTKRVANYSFIPPGHYTFHVIAGNNDDVWNETGVSLPFIVLPHLWQRWWFRGLSSLLVVTLASAIAWFETRRRLHRRLEILERQQAVERERSRIAKDIHDDLGASLTRISMLSLSAGREAEVPDHLAIYFDRIYGTARELTRAMDEIVWAVNPQHDTVDSLANYLSRFAHDFLNAAHIRCRLDVPLQLPTWPVTAEVRHNLFLAFKEVLHNVVSHSAATEVKVALKLEHEKLFVTVTDNGCGFIAGDSPRAAQAKPDRIAQGNGLVNIKRRMAELSGCCEIQSSAEGGTTVILSVPIHI